MPSKSKHAEYLTHLVDRFDQGGAEALSEKERIFLAFLFAGEGRTGGLTLEGADEVAIRRHVCNHMRRSLSQNDFTVTLDHRDELAVQAKTLSTERRPLASLILYATWIEHWLNGVIVAATRRRGLSDEDSVRLVRETPMRAKHSWLLALLGLPPLAKDRQKALVALTELRNAFVHYKWSARTPDELVKEEEGVRRIVDSAPDLLDYLREYDAAHVSSPDVSTAIQEMLRIDLESKRAEWRASAALNT